MRHVTLVNRSSKVLQGVWDGKHYEIAPGKHSFPEIMAMKFKDQNPVMGSEDPYTLDKEYLIGIEEFNDPCTPIEQSNAIALSKDVVEKLRTGELKIVNGNGLYSPRGIDATANPFTPARGNVETNFSKD